MATPSLDAYRQLNPQDTRPDSEVVPEILSRLGNDAAQYPDLLEYANNMEREYKNAHRPDILKEGINAVISGVGTGKSQLYSTAAQAGDILGIDKLKDFGLHGYQQSLQDASPYSPTVPSITDIHSPTDALYYGVGLAGSQAAPIAATIGASAVGAAIGGAVGNAPGASAGAMLGLTGAGYLQSQNYAQLEQSGAQDAALTSAAIGVAGGLLMTVVPSRVIRGAFGAESQSMAQMGMSHLLERAEKTVPGLSASIIHGVGEHGFNNSLLGVSNELVQMAGELYAHRDNPNFEISDKELTDRILNGAAAGGAIGAVFGAAGAPSERNKLQQMKDFAKAQIADLNARKASALTQFITPKDPYAGLETPGEVSTDASPVDAALMNSPRAASHAAYAELFDDQADTASKEAARKRYNEQRLQNFYQSGRAKELLNQQLANEETPPLIKRTFPAPKTVVAENSEPPSIPKKLTIEAAETWKNDWGKWLSTVPENKPLVWEDVPSKTGEKDIRALSKNIGNPDKPWRVTKFVKKDDAYTPTGHLEYASREDAMMAETQDYGKPIFGKFIDRVPRPKGVLTEPISTPLPGVIDTPGALEHGGDIPLAPELHDRLTVLDALPELRKETTRVPEGAFPDEIEAMAGKGVRLDERTKNTTKRLVAVKDNKTGQVTLYPIYKSQGNRFRVDNGVKAKVDSRRALAAALGRNEADVQRAYREGGAERRALDKVWDELSSGGKEDQFLSELVADKGKTVLGFLDSTEPIEGKHYLFANEERYRDEASFTEAGNIVTKGTHGGGGGVPQILKKLNELSPRDSRALQILASTLESLPHLQASAEERAHETGYRSRLEKNISADAALLIRGLLTSGTDLRAEVFAEKLKATTDPTRLFRRSKGHLFGLFTPEKWEAFKSLTEHPNVSAIDLLQAVDQGLESYGWKSREDYLKKIVPEEGGTQRGDQIFDKTGAKSDDEDNLSEQAATGEGGAASFKQAENSLPSGEGDAERAAHIGSLSEDAIDKIDLRDTETPIEDSSKPEFIPEKAQGFAGLTGIEMEGLARRLSRERGEDSTEARNIMEARADSEISTPKEDYEFQAVKEDLAAILDKIFTASRVDKPELTDDFLYGVYSNLDKIVRDSNPRPSSYRVTSDAIQRIFHNTVGWLADKGVDVRLVQQTVDSQVELLRNEWGRSISHEDGRRMVVVTMADLSEPSRDNLRVLMHEVAHQLFADEPVWVQRLLHESVERLNDLQLDVFSKTLDDRIKNRDLPAHVLMEEVLAEHLAHTGIETTQARTLGTRLIGALQSVIAKAMLAYSQLRGIVLSPAWGVKYAELRFLDMLDKVVSPKTDLDTLTGNIRNTAKFKGTWYRAVGGKFDVEKFDAASGQFVLHDVVDDSTLASEFNLDNKLSFSDVVVRDSRSDLMRKKWETEFGLTDKPTTGEEILKRVVANVEIEPEMRVAADAINKLSGFGKEVIVRMAAGTEDMRQMLLAAGSPAYYDNAKHEIVINPHRVGGYSSHDMGMLITHEMQHAATSRAIVAYGLFTRSEGTPSERAEAVATLVGNDGDSPLHTAKLIQDVLRVVPAVEKLDNIFNHLKDKNFADDEYGMTNLDEFASESLSNRTFQMKLAREELPEHLRVRAGRRSVLKALTDIITRMFNGFQKGSALESSLNATEQLMMVADPLLKRASDGMRFAPVSEEESDARVKKDFEYEFAALNSQSDLYHSLFDEKARTAGTDFDSYLKKILGVFNPDDSRRQLELKVGARSRPIPVNQELRLNDSKGNANRIEATTDRAQLTKRLVETISNAQGKLAGKMMSLKDLMPRLEKDHQRAQDRIVRFETMLHDVAEIRNNALKVLRKGLRGAERNAARLVQWSARHEGLAGIAADFFRVADEDAIPADYADLLFESVDEHQDDFFITDALTAAQQHGMDFEAMSPREIETRIQEIVRSTKDARLVPFSDGSPQARADLALITYYAKTAPEDMAALAIRVEKDPERKDAILKTVQKIIRGNFTDTGGLNDLFKDVRTGDVRVGRAKQALTNSLRQLNQAKKNLEVGKLRAAEMEKATGILKEAVRPFQAELGIHAQNFEPYNGAKILVTNGNEIKEGTLRLGPDSFESVNKLLMDNIAWLKTHELHDPTWHAINDQVEGLKRVAGNQIEGDFRDSFWTKRLGSIPERLNNIGSSILRLAGDRLIRYHGLRTSVEREIVQGHRVTEDYKNAMKVSGFENSYSGYKDTFFNPAFHFLRHLTLLPGVTEGENRQFAKEQLKMFFMRNDQTRSIVTKPGVYDAIWKSLESNAKASKDVANKAKEWNVLVEDSEIKVQNPRTGRVENALRPAMDVGLMTTQASITKIFGVKDLVEQVKGQNGEVLWPKWAHIDKEIDPATGQVMPAPDIDPKLLFTPDVLHHFVRPYIYDTGTLHLNAPELLDGKTKNKSNPLNVQNAFETADGDMVKFASSLFDMEYTLQNEASVDHAARKQKFVVDTINFFKKQYLKIYNMSEAQEQFNKRGLTTDRFLSSPMMDSVKAQDFPPDFVDYNVYDHTTLRNLLSQLAAHAAMGRDLGLFAGQKDPNGGIMWELNHGELELRAKQAEYTRLGSEIKRVNPTASVKEIDAEISKKVGKEQLEKYKGLTEARAEIRKAEQEIMTYLMSPNGATRDMQIAQSAVGILAGGMVNNWKSAMNQVAQTFEPFMSYGIGKTGWRQAMRSMEATARSGAGAFVQAVSGQASLASKYGRFMAEHGLGIDPANEVTSSQVLADTGKNNVYEDKRLLGWLRKGRSIAFDTGFRGAEGERIAPKFRPQAPFSMMMIAANQGAIESEIRLYDDVLKQSIQSMKDTPGSLTDPTFKFTNENIKLGESTFDKIAFDELTNEFRLMGTTLEIETRSLVNGEREGKPLGEIVVPPHLARLISGEALRRMSLPNDISSAPVWMQNSSLGRLAMPLISWSLNKTNQIVGALKEPNGEASRRAMVAGIASLAFGMVPAAVAISLVLDQYDENVLGKKSNLVGFNFDSPSQTGVALMERVGRVGTFGMAGDLVNGVRVYGTSGDLRGLSIDQRVVFVNTLMSIIGLASTAYNQEGTLTYDTFYRPLINTMGGGGILQNQQILNNITNSLMGAPVFTAEAETTARLNAQNYLRGAGRVTGLDVRTSSGRASTIPTPIKPWVSEMTVAAYSGDSAQFVQAYRKAITAATEEGKPDPADYVKRAFESQHPLRSTFGTPPTKVEVSQLLGALSDKGRTDVTRALEYFNSYAASLGIKPYDGKELVTKKAPVAFQTVHGF